MPIRRCGARSSWSRATRWVVEGAEDLLVRTQADLDDRIGTLLAQDPMGKAMAGGLPDDHLTCIVAGVLEPGLAPVLEVSGEPGQDRAQQGIALVVDRPVLHGP